MKALRLLIEVAAAVALILYPVAVYFSLSAYGPRVAAGLLLFLVLPVAVTRARRIQRGALGALAFTPLLVAVLLAVAFFLNREGLVLMVPVAINALFAAAFCWTFYAGAPMVERFARLTDPDLNPHEIRWCRQWTLLWTMYFIVNAAVTLGLALWAPLAWWTTHTGLIAYLVMGLLFGTEYCLRKFRFGRLGDHVLDRALKLAFSAIRSES